MNGNMILIPAAVFHSITRCVAIRSSFGNSNDQFITQSHKYAPILLATLRT